MAAASEPTISAEKLKAAVTLGLSLEQAVKTGAVPLPPDKLKALQTLGLTLQQAVEKGVIKPTPAPDVKATPPEAKALPTAAKAAEGTVKEPPSAEKVPQTDSAASAQDKERRQAAAARFAASKGGNANAAKASQSQVAAGEGGDALAIPGGTSDEILVEAVGSVVNFKDASGAVRVLAPQASEVAYLVSDAVFWPLLRRIGAEILALESGAKDLDGLWASAPCSSEGALQFAETRGYLLPKGLAAPAADGGWRRALLAEVASDLMTMRIAMHRGFDLPALAGPTEADQGWIERPESDLQGVASAVDSSASVGLAQELVKDLGAAVSLADAEQPLSEKLAAIAEAASARASSDGSTPSASGHAAALKGGWNLMQEMSIREAVTSLRKEYTMRRQILLNRFDCSVQVMCNCERAAVGVVQRKTSEVLSRMWAGWRQEAGEAPPLSEWSALAVTRGMLARAVTARVSAPGARSTSSVKKVSIGAVPNRGGKPEGYTKKDPSSSSQQATSSTEQPKAASAVTVTMPKAQRGPRQRSFASGGTASGSASTASGDGATSSAAAATTSSTDAANEPPPVPIAAKAEEKKAPMGARSTNKEAQKEYRQLKRKEWEGKTTNDYYEELAKHRKPA